MSASLRIERWQPGDAETEARRASFVAAARTATIFHEPIWYEAIRSTYGHECFYWIAQAGSRVVGVLPVTLVKHPLLGAKLVASPYQFARGAPLAEDAVIARALVEHVVRQAQELRVSYLEIRSDEPVELLGSLGFVAADSQLVLTKTPLKQIEKKNLRKGHWAERHYAQRRGVQIQQATSLEAFREFRAIYQREGRRFGSPQAPWELFRAYHELGTKGHCKLYLARTEVGSLLGGLLMLEGGGTAFVRCTAHPSPEAIELRVNKALYWHALNDAAARGLETFDFGITWTGQKDLLYFKEGWNGTSRPAWQYFLPVRGKPRAAGGYFEGFGLAKAVWRRLPPAVIEILGREVTRWVC